MILASIGAGFQLDAPAAESFKRMLAAGMPFSYVTETYRPYSDQVDLFLSRYRVQWTGSGLYGDVRWWKFKRYVRFSSLGMAAVPGTSRHGFGNAIDINDPMRSWIRARPQYGWDFPIATEDWHTEYNILRDAEQFAKPAVPTMIDKDDDMRYFAISHNPGSDIYELGPSGSWLKLNPAQWSALGKPVPEIVTHDGLRALDSLAAERRKSLA